MTSLDESVATQQSSERFAGLIAAMTTAEKASLLAGASMWLTAPIERLGVPAIKVSDGPNGARGGGGLVGGTLTSACFPAAISLASTWNVDLVGEIGTALGEEAQSKGAHLLLGPTVNIHRSPLNGRNFECYSEDPYLSARMAVAYITGLQGTGVGATVKHFVCNDSEFQRNTINSEVGERALREIYLPPFEAAVREAGSWAVMAGYNKVNGTYAGENRAILRDLLKDQWAFTGIVMSDWFGTKSTEDAANNGMDLEMPGPPQFRGARLVEAIEAGRIDPAAVDEAVGRILHLIEKAGAQPADVAAPEQAIDRPEHRALLRRAAAEGAVLLKHDEHLLPLEPSMLRSIAIIGPNAKVAVMHGGGSAQVNAHYAVTPFEGISRRAGGRVQIGYELGCTNHRLLPRLDPALVAEQTFRFDYFNNYDLSGQPIQSAQVKSAEQAWFGSPAEGVDPRKFSARLSTSITPETSGQHAFSLVSAGLSKLSIDGTLVIDNWTSQTRGENYFGLGTTEVVATLDWEAGEPHSLELEYSSEGTMMTAVRLGYLPPVPDDAIELAATLAAESDVVVLCIGTNGDWESEGYDRPNMDLPGRQDELAERVVAANPRTVVVLQTGSPVTMPWFDRAAAVVQAWFPGQECGNAIADVLFGDVNPSGRLPQTFPVRLEDNPAFINYPGENGTVRYGEGIFVGYRYYEKKLIEPLLPFGFGRSYTIFTYDGLRSSANQIGPDDSLTISVDVTNTGKRAGQDVVQCYVRDVVATLTRPPKELKAFAKVLLQPGETKTVELRLDRPSFAFWDDATHEWVVEAGEFEILLGSSSADIFGRLAVSVSETFRFGGPGTHKP